MSQRSRKNRKRSFWSIFFGSDSAGQRITGSRSLSVGSGDVKPKKNLKERWKRFKKRLTAVKNVELNDSRKNKKSGFSLKNLRKTFAAASFQDDSNSKRRKKPNRYQKQFQILLTNLPMLVLLSPVVFVAIWQLFVLTLSNSEKSDQPSLYAEKFENAILSGNLREAEILLKKQAERDVKSTNNLLLDQARLGRLTGKTALSEQIEKFLAADTSGIYGPAILEMTKKQIQEFQQTDEMKLTIERQLLRAMADKRVESASRIELGRFYRKNERLNDAARILEPVRTIEEGALELSLTKSGLKQFNEMKLLLNPFVATWRQQIENPSDKASFIKAATGLILFGEEEKTIEIADDPKNTLSQNQKEDIIQFGFNNWMQRLLRDGQRAHTDVLTIINKFEPARPCLAIWFPPLMQIANSDSPMKQDATNLFKKIIENQSCSAMNLSDICREVKSWGEIQLASSIVKRIMDKFSSEKEILLQLAIEFDQIEPKNQQMAIEVLNHLIKIHPLYPNARETRAEISIRNNQFAEAIPDLLATLPFNSIYPEFHLKLANCYRKTGNQPDAILHEAIASELSFSKQTKPKSEIK